MSLTSDWSIHQLSGFLAAVSAATDPGSALRAGVERAAEVLDAEIGFVTCDGAICTAVGVTEQDSLLPTLAQITRPGEQVIDDPELGRCTIGAVALEPPEDGWLVLLRSGDEPFSHEERVLLRGMARVLVHALTMVRILERERDLRERSDRQAAENAELARSLTARQHLLKTTSHLQRLIARRAPLQEILDSITTGAAGLIDVDVAALRLVDADRPEETTIVSSHHLDPAGDVLVRRATVHEGVGGRAIAEDRLVCFDDYATAPTALEAYAESGLRTAMAAPVHENGTVVGSLTVGSYEEGRVYTREERDALAAFAEHAGLALTDSRTVEAMNAALHDSLTGLPNRALFLDRLERCLARDGGTVAVLFCDLDHFKRVNDSLGHDVGDALLVSVADRLRGCLRPGDTVARLGGDEFTAILEDVESVDDAIVVARRILDALSEPFTVGSRSLYVSASVGVAVAHPGTDETGNVLRSADLAMYQAKDSGRGQIRVFHSEMSDRALRRLEMETELRRALELSEFVLHYQPLVSLVTGVTVGVEALIRWEHPQRGLVLPGEFIPYAEETGLILPLGAWVLQAVCAAARSWQDTHGDLAPVVHVNISPRQFQQPEFVPELAELLRVTGLRPALLTLEITEGVLLQDTQATIAKCHEIRDLGVRLALDDFGTGYSSLSYLRSLPVDEVKIDRSFVDGVDASPKESALAQAIVDLAHTLGLHTVAEGIERVGQLDHLRRLSCDWGQGFLMSEPVPRGEIDRLLEGAAAVDVQQV